MGDTVLPALEGLSMGMVMGRGARLEWHPPYHMCGKTNSRVKLYLLLGIKPDPGMKKENKNNVGWLKKADIGHVLVNGTVRGLTQSHHHWRGPSASPFTQT